MILFAQIFLQPRPTLLSKLGNTNDENLAKNTKNKCKKSQKWTDNRPSFTINKTFMPRDVSVDVKKARNPLDLFFVIKI